MTILLATHNPHKAREFSQMLDCTVQPFSASIVEETGVTFAENALLKARAIPSENIALADDSGLIIDALDGRPGVQSARFLGTDTPYTVKNQHILDLMHDVPWEKRTARFVCALACVFPDGRTLTVEGVLEGYIAHAPAGDNGFGYDPIFWVPSHNRTLAQLSAEEKNAISHRFQALCKVRAFLS